MTREAIGQGREPLPFPAKLYPETLTEAPSTSPVTNGHAAALPSQPEPMELWTRYSKVCCADFHEPDLQGQLCILCAGCSHYYPSEKPVWLLVLGPSGSGKTELGAQSLLALPLSRAVDDLTPKAFLSSWNKGPKNDLLPKPGGSSLWVAADFSTLCSLSSDDRKKVAASLRQIWDGKISRDTGQGPSLAWWGKVSLVAFATPEIEDQWGPMRGLGERFVYCRWRAPTSPQGRLGAIRASRKQLGRVESIRKELKEILIQLCDPRLRGYADVELPSDSAMLQFDEMASLVCILRTPVVRDYDPQRSILSLGTPELPTRVSSAFSQVARTHQAMFNLPPMTESLSLVRRLAVDAVPLVRKSILDTVYSAGSSLVTYSDLLDSTGVPKTTLSRQLEELTALGVLDKNFGLGEWVDRVASLTPSFLGALKSSTLLDKQCQTP